ncbi:hypothetical protein [Streptomyces sp. NPDC007063]|uniref:hypothetical protein n=1 Tax=Streptomyces sp. NPDC007063 TaxID=3364772 RepID=UPI0036D0430D
MNAVAHYEFALLFATDEHVAQPLWYLPPCARPALLHERRRRGILQGDPEPIGDVEYH